MAAIAIHSIGKVEAVDEVDTEEAYRCRVQIWILRILLKLKAYPKVGVDMNIGAEALVCALELEMAPGEQADVYGLVGSTFLARGQDGRRFDSYVFLRADVNHVAQRD